MLNVDPPYLDTTRAGRDRSRGRDYRLDTDDVDAHRALAAALHTTPVMVRLSGYPSPLYDELYPGWHRLDVVMHRPSGNPLPAPGPARDRGDLEGVPRIFIRDSRAQAAPDGTAGSPEYARYEDDPAAPAGTTWISTLIDQDPRDTP